MKKTLFSFGAICFLFAGAALADEALAKPVLRAVTAPNYAPYEFLDNGVLKGFDVDVMNEIASRLGYELEYKYMDFDGLIPSLKSGKADIIAAIMKKTPIREKAIDFTIEFKHSSNYVLAKSSEASGDKQTAATTEAKSSEAKPTEASGKIPSCTDELLKAKKIGAELGTVQFDMIKAHKLEPVGFSEAAIGVLALLKDKIDAIMLDKQAAGKFMQKNPQLAVLCEQDDPAGQGFGLNKDSLLLGDIDKAIASMLADGTIDKLSKKWGL